MAAAPRMLPDTQLGGLRWIKESAQRSILLQSHINDFPAISSIRGKRQAC